MPEAPITYGSGSTLFTSGDARQVLELGNEIHYFNPDATPLLAISGKVNKVVTPVPKFEWQEDEYFIQRSQTFALVSSTHLTDSNVTGENDKGCILICEKQSQLELFEKGGIYAASKTGSANLSGMIAYMCIAIGKEVAHASPTDKMVQLVGFDATSGDTYTYDSHATTVAILAAGASGTLTLTYKGTGGAGSLSGIVAAMAGQTTLTDNDVFTAYSLSGHAEGAEHREPSRKKVRNLVQCTQIFREPFMITGTAKEAKYYGIDELTRLEKRSLKKYNADIEWALLSQGAIDLDATSEYPKRKFAGFGVGLTTGVVQSNNGEITTDLQLTEASFTMTQFNNMLKRVYEDLVNGSTQKDMFLSTDFITAITNRVLVETNVSLPLIMGKDERAGLVIRQYQGPVGPPINLIVHPLLKGSLAKYGIIVDFENFDLRPMRNRDTMYKVDFVRKGQDGQWNEWLGEMGPQIMNEQTHAIVKLV